MVLFQFKIEENWFTSGVTLVSIMGGISSIHVTKSSTNWAYRARPCVAIFPSLRVCLTSFQQKYCSCKRAMKLSTEGDTLLSYCRAQQIIMESFFTIRFWILMFEAKFTAISIAFATVSNVPKGTCKFLLMAATTLPWSSPNYHTNP